MTRSTCPRWERPEAFLSLQINATNWPPTDEIDVCNDDLVMAITEVIIGNTILTKNHLVSPTDLFRLNPKQLDMKLWEKGCVPSPSCPRQMHQRGRRRAALGAPGAAVVAREELRQAAYRWRQLH
jgi:hypothetical protein